MYFSLFLRYIITMKTHIQCVNLPSDRLSMHTEERVENRCLSEEIVYDVVANVLITIAGYVTLA